MADIKTIDFTKLAAADVQIDGIPMQAPAVLSSGSPVYATRARITDGIGIDVKGITHIEGVLNKAGLNYNVIQTPVFRNLNGASVEIKNRVANVRQDTGEFIEIVSNRYTPFQNRQAFNFLEGMLASGALQVETAGQFDYGAVWIEARTPEDLTIMGDKYYPFALIRNSHDGTSGVKVCFTFTRVVCQNTLAMAVKGAPRVWQARHLRSIEGRMEDAKRMLEVMDRYTEEYPVMVEKLASINLSEMDIVNVLRKVFPLKETATEKTIKNSMQNAKEILQIYNYTPDLKKFHGTALGFIHAISDYESHKQPGRETENWKVNRLQTMADGNPMIDTAQKALLEIPA